MKIKEIRLVDAQVNHTTAINKPVVLYRIETTWEDALPSEVTILKRYK